MPFRTANVGVSEVRKYLNVPRHLLVKFCKKLLVEGVYYSVKDAEKGMTGLLLSGSGSQEMWTEMSKLIASVREIPVEISDSAVEYLATHCRISDIFVLSGENRFSSTVFIYGEDSDSQKDAFMDAVEKFVFDIPIILAVIIVNMTSTKMKENEDLYLVPSGRNTIVIPMGEKEDTFYKEFFSIWEKIVVEKFTTTLDDGEAYGIIASMSIKDVFFRTSKGNVYLQGLRENIDAILEDVKAKIFEEETKQTKWIKKKERRGHRNFSGRDYYR